LVSLPPTLFHPYIRIELNPNKVLNIQEFYISYSGRKIMNKIILISMIGMLLLGGVGIRAITTMKLPTGNHAPNAPTLDGPRRVIVGVLYKWSFNSTDPDGDNITYYVDWGDECGGAQWYGPFPSSEKVEIGHTYTSKNILLINSLAVDEKGAESNRTYFEVTISKSSSIDFIFIPLLERFPHAFPILRYLLDLT